MAKMVLDSSALIAFLSGEPGAQSAAESIPGALLCSVNLAEIFAVLMRRGETNARVRTIVALSQIEIVAFDAGLAEACGALVSRTRQHGLSLADCACLALGEREKLPVLTADRAWKEINLGLDVRLIR
jgi:ribonuclease VapC